MVFKTTEPFFSKAQLEVWEWKQTLAEETQHLTTAEALNYLVEKSQKTVAHLKNQKRLPETTITDPLR